jgi:formylglycine-generating enzyme required for sulfatase activity
MKKILILLVCAAFILNASANNIQVSNITVAQPNITFTIQWDNSWNTSNNVNPLYPSNWDGAWVFIKYQNNIDNIWKHAAVSAISTDHTISGGILQIDPAADGMGVFIRRSAPGTGNISSTTVTLKMNPLTGTGTFNFKVFGTEVVYIPPSDYQLGDGNVSGQVYFTPQDITLAKQAAGIGAGSLFTSSPAVPAAFPMGYGAYYMMKYEVTNEEWADFLNTLTYDQQATRIDVVPNSAINTFAYANNGNAVGDNILKIEAAGLNNTKPAKFGCDLDGDNVVNETNDGQNMAISVINKADLFAYLDWCGLRPMTEMEFEKACRGTQNRLAGELAWGTTDVNPHNRLNMTNPGMATEIWAGAQANGQFTGGTGPNGNGGATRAGVYANAAGGRLTAGAGFYGNMDLSGNVWEMCVTVDASGVAFTGANGNGSLTVNGDADAANWPPNYSNAAPFGTIIRGGSFYEGQFASYCTTSYRLGGQGSARSFVVGGRGVRTAP